MSLYFHKNIDNFNIKIFIYFKIFAQFILNFNYFKTTVYIFFKILYNNSNCLVT